MRFLHTADWQLGMTRHFLSDEDQALFDEARLEAITRIGQLADERSCAFVVVAGDVFETNQPTPRTIGRALERLRDVPVPVLLLPGNHEPYNPGSVYRSRAFLDGCPDHVEVLHDRTPRHPAADVEVIGAPWTSKQPLTDLVTETCAGAPADGARRVIVGHGNADVLSGDHGAAGTVHVAALEEHLAAGRARYVALGDRHSTASVGSTGRIWFSGAPEPTSYREDDAGNVLVVELPDDGDHRPDVEAVRIGTWRFVELVRELDGDADLEALLADLDALEDRARTIVKVKVQGTLSLTQAARLDTELERRADLFGALEHPERHTDIVVRPTDGDLDGLELTGYAATAMARLREDSRADGDLARAATDALALLVRLDAEVRA
ncbi:MAG: metallophosphoesterase [Nitriliruptoraceae bacterium]|nr:metallophosphoesterase [Nitriliruptoraceae bacterium]